MNNPEEKLQLSTLKEITRSLVKLHLEKMLKKSYEKAEFSPYHNHEFCNLFTIIQDGVKMLNREINSTYISLENRKKFLSESNRGSSVVGTSTENHGLKVISQINMVLIKTLDKIGDGAAVLKYAENKWPDSRFTVRVYKQPNFFTVQTIDVPLVKLTNIANWINCASVEEYSPEENKNA